MSGVSTLVGKGALISRGAFLACVRDLWVSSGPLSLTHSFVVALEKLREPATLLKDQSAPPSPKSASSSSHCAHWGPI